MLWVLIVANNQSWNQKIKSKNYYFFLFLNKNICCGNSLEAPQGAPTTYVFIEK